MATPYKTQPNTAFWKHFIANQQSSLTEIFTPRFSIDVNTRIATAGSCFAQHISNALQRSSIQIMDMEPAPFGLNTDISKLNHFGIYSARYGNIYTARHLRQLVNEAITNNIQTEVWQRPDGKYVDAMRPQVEQHGFPSEELVILHRKAHIARVRQMLVDMNVFIFTLGLTETWQNKDNDLCFPIAPGVIAGNFEPTQYHFVNFSYIQVLEDITQALAAINQLRREHQKTDVKVLLTVSPVPLAATASNQHVFTANCYSKSILRAIAGELTQTMPNVDYFPSYELITSPWREQPAYNESGREVKPEAVANVMQLFLEIYQLQRAEAAHRVDNNTDPLCDEIVLGAINT
ncbi:GSCFA domain-containing protein [Rheinheimera baltica]|uniref:GSCFA domain-containing protein n=1 Tax=Rheinheimera baltica TaxID=67576 RepID=A0ABT9I3E2_9GAMM|nr:GSCFA domain-containing protein [Rheinheimera baltica]MDP5137879.1 GSCFA domain-containing protein [Rheinheimera baltica]MDP5149762.1 GSCFA domain-containing protein [Rheinheimera baltica]